MITTTVAVNKNFDLMSIPGFTGRKEYRQVILSRIEYLNEEGELVSHEITGSDPTLMGLGDYRLAYITKLNGQRWGVALNVDRGNRGFVAVDIDSPIRNLVFTLLK